MTAGASFCGDDDLGYRGARTAFVDGLGLRLDEAYRLAHLPLVASGHPDVIVSKPGAPYFNGRHPRVRSLALHVPWRALADSAEFAALEAELRRAAFAGKIAWAAGERRRDRLHATVCGSLGVGAPPALSAAQRTALARLDAFDVELRGLFSGNVNVGRLYLRAYPERRAEGDALRLVQRSLGRAESGLYLVGLWNLTDHLDAAQAAELAALIEAWWNRPLARLRVERLRVIAATDDLCLDGGFEDDVPLTGP